MNKLLKTFLVLCFCSSCSFSVFSQSQFNQNTGVYQRKKSPTNSSTTQSYPKSTPSKDIYNEAGIRTAIYEESEANAIITDDKSNNPGHTITPNSQNSNSYSQKRATNVGDSKSQVISSNTYSPSTNTTSANDFSKINTATSKNKNSSTNYSKSSNSPYKIKRVSGLKSAPNSNNGAYSNAKTLNFDVLKESNNRRTTNNNTSTYSSSQRRSTSYYSNYYNNSVKIYNQKGQRVSLNYSNTNRGVIIVPRQGLTVTGIVTSDDPGRSITIKDNQGKSLTYQYTDMDALVNI